MAQSQRAQGQGAFFGRRKSKALRSGQAHLTETLLPRLALPEALPAALGELFDPPCATIALEIGFGGAEHLLSAARAAPDIGIIGCEPFVNGMAKLLSAIARENLGNIRLWPEDAAPLLARLPGGSLTRIDLFYPDPWPKRRQRKRRFVTPETLAAIASALQPGGLFRFASDIDDYAGWTLKRLMEEPRLQWLASQAADWCNPPDGWVQTRYEAKALLAGRKPTYITAQKGG